MIRAALVETGTAVDDGGQPAPPTRGGGGLADPLKADVPLVLASPASVSFGLVAAGATAPAHVDPRRRRVAAPGCGTSPSRPSRRPPERAARVPADRRRARAALDLIAVTTAAAADGDLSGFVRLTRGTDVRRHPVLAARRATGARAARRPPLTAPGAAHRQHERQAVARLPLPLPGRSGRGRRFVHAAGARAGVPRDAEEARGELRRRDQRARPGRARSSRASSRPGTRTGSPATPALPVNLNPYLAQFGDPVLAAGAVRPLAGAYDVVFDSDDRGWGREASRSATGSTTRGRRP